MIQDRPGSAASPRKPPPKAEESSSSLDVAVPTEGLPLRALLLFLGFSFFYGYLVWVWANSTLSAWDQFFESAARNTSLSLRQMVDREVQILKLLSVQPNRRDLLFLGTGNAQLEKGSWSVKSAQPVRSGMDSNWVHSVLSEKLKEFPLSLEVGAVHISLVDLPPLSGSTSTNRNSSRLQAYLFAYLDEELHLALIDLSLWSGLLDATLRTDFEVALVNREGQTLAHVERAYIGKSAGFTTGLKGSVMFEPVRVADTNLILWIRPRSGVYESRLSSIAVPLSLAVGGYALMLLAAFFVVRGWVRRSQAWAQALALAQTNSLREARDFDEEALSYRAVSSRAVGQVPDGQLPLGLSADSPTGVAQAGVAASMGRDHFAISSSTQANQKIPSGRAVPKHFLLSNEALSEKMKLIDELTDHLGENSPESSYELDLDAIEKLSTKIDFRSQNSVERDLSKNLSLNQKSDEKLDDKIDQPPKTSSAIKGEG